MTRRTIGAAFVPLILLLAACTSGGGAATASPSAVATPLPASLEPSPSASEEPAASAEPSASAESEAELKVVDGGATLGMYLVDGDGKTLYLFTNDTKDSGKSTCNGECATNWPPLLAESADAVKLDDGVAGTVTVITRDDGESQVAYNGTPLYYFAGDTAAGQTNGQGLSDKWFVVKP